MNSTFSKEQVIEIEAIIKQWMIKDKVGEPYFKYFDHAVDRWNQVNAYTMARLSELAYENGDEVRERLSAYEEDSFSDLQFYDLKETDTQFFILTRADDIIIAFRGTSNFNDWKSNIKFKKVSFGDFGKGKVHKGFYNAFVQSWPFIKEAIDAAAGQNRKIWLTGHSLGGAIATLAMAALKNCLSDSPDRACVIGGLYTYGQPKVGDLAFQSQFKGLLHRCVRVVFCNDPVPLLPFPKYYHVGASKKISRTGGFRFLRNKFAYRLEQAFDIAIFGSRVLVVFFLARSRFSEALLAYFERHGMEKYIKSFNIK